LSINLTQIAWLHYYSIYMTPSFIHEEPCTDQIKFIVAL